ncbi:MAG: helix-turn-helix domain-containing protein [Verrucomicrobiaceae bacterium]|nr:helix-turn-helix domain-containing protein [Verrucomicrobiaceae bacterium]
MSAKEMMPVTGRLGAVLRRWREQMGKSLEEVAEAAGLTPVGLHNLETGKASSKSDSYERVAEALGLCYPLIVLEAFVESRPEGTRFIVEFPRLMALLVLE